MSEEVIEIPLRKATYEELQQVICELQVERYINNKEVEQLKEDKKKVWEWVIYKQQHSIEPFISTDELDEILEILGDKE